jgi:hypothetical protein
MSTAWNQILWGQLGAALDMLENAIVACPDELWSDLSKKPTWVSNGVVGFWYVAYHTLFYLDLGLSGGVEEGFAPPAPFDLKELDPAGLLPDRPYTKDALRAYVGHCRKKCRATLAALTEENAKQPCRWGKFDLSFAELMLYTMRHVQHHTGQLNLMLRQQTASAPRWVRRAEPALESAAEAGE